MYARNINIHPIEYYVRMNCISIISSIAFAVIFWCALFLFMRNYPSDRLFSVVFVLAGGVMAWCVSAGSGAGSGATATATAPDVEATDDATATEDATATTTDVEATEDAPATATDVEATEDATATEDKIECLDDIPDATRTAL